jgi:hypothetical protein
MFALPELVEADLSRGGSLDVVPAGGRAASGLRGPPVSAPRPEVSWWPGRLG